MIETPLLLLLAATALQRLTELRISRRNLARLHAWAERNNSQVRDCESRGRFALMVVLQVVLLTAPAVENALGNRATPPALWLTAVGLWALGQTLRLASMRTLGGWWNARGAVADRQPILSGGPYRLLRHPNYLGVLLEAVALPLAGSTWICLAVLTPAVALVVVRRMRAEEALLRERTTFSAALGDLPALFPRLAPSRGTPRQS